jgi:hypothetical protein
MIDELEVVRRVGAEDAAPDAAARERVRARVLSTGARTSPPRRARRVVGALVPVAVVLLGVALVVLTGGGEDPGRDFSGERPAAEAPAQAPSLFPAPDEFLYVRSRSSYLVCGGGELGAEAKCRLGDERTRESWVSARGRGLIIETTDGAPRRTRIGDISLTIGNRRFTHAELAAYRPTGRELLEDLQRGRQPGQGNGGASYPYTQITDALRGVPMPLPVRRALIEALPLVPGVAERGPATDAEGRKGVLFTRVVDGQREEVVVDPETATMLEERTFVATAGAVPGDFEPGDRVGHAVYLERAVVTAVEERP